MNKTEKQPETPQILEHSVSKRFFHDLSQPEYELLVSQKKTWSDVIQEYQQPKWCSYQEALNGKMGCWSLTSRKISNENSCQSCVRYIPNVC